MTAQVQIVLTREQADWWYAEASCGWSDYLETCDGGEPHPRAVESYRAMIDQLAEPLGYVGWLEQVGVNDEGAIAEQLREKGVGNDG